MVSDQQKFRVATDSIKTVRLRTVSLQTHVVEKNNVRLDKIDKLKQTKMVGVAVYASTLQFIVVQLAINYGSFKSCTDYHTVTF